MVRRSHSAEPRIWSSVVLGLLSVLAEQNVNTAKILAASDLTVDDIQKPQSEIPLKKYLKFLESAAKETNDPLVGIRLARLAGPETLGAIGFLFLSSRTLGEAMGNLQHYISLLQGRTHVQLVQNEDEISFSYQLYQASDMARRQDVEFSLALTCRLIRIYSGYNVRISSVNFRHSPAAPKIDYERLLKAPVFFEQDANSLSFPAAFGQIRSKVLDCSLAPILQDFLDGEVNRRRKMQTFTDEVSRLLMEGGVTPPITAAKVAHRLGLSQATFYRRLKSENTSFSHIVDDRNFELARSYLTELSLPITQIAHLIGFAESASFTRAFIRWSGGETPSQFRKQNAHD